MRIIDLKPVRRCGQCNHLIPADFERCPYCSGTAYVEPSQNKVAAAPEAPKAPKERKPMSAATKKKLMWAGCGIVAVAAIVLIINFVMGFFRLDKSITEELSESDIEAITEDQPDFGELYEEISNIRSQITSEEDKKMYGNITYRQMINFLEHYSKAEYCDGLKKEIDIEYEQKVHKPAVPKVNALVKKWKDYMKEHDPNSYLKITCGERYETMGDSYYAGFYFTLSYPKGADKVEDCYVKYGLYSKHGEYWSYNAVSEGSLYDLQLRNKDAAYRWNGISSYEKDIYDEWEMKTEIISVTLTDGRVISADEADEVPGEVAAYIDDPSEENEFVLIKDLIDTDYPDKSFYASKRIGEKLRDEDPLCYKLVEKTNKYGGGVTRGWQYVDEDDSGFDCDADMY